MQVLAYAPSGAEGVIIRVEADIRRGIPGIDITGLAEGAVREARERVRAGFRNSGLSFPQDRILINLAPAGLRKEGASLDLPIAVSVMAAAGMVPIPGILMVLGELELSGRVRPVRGVLAAVAEGIREGVREFIVPLGNAGEAAILAGTRAAPGTGAGQAPAGSGAIRFFAAATLAETVHALRVRAETGGLPEDGYIQPSGTASGYGGGAVDGDFSEVQGQGRCKRALEIAAAGGHNVLVFGPPGSGKTMLARRFPSIMPLLEPDEAVEVTRLYSLAGQIKAACAQEASFQVCTGGLIRRPPFRSPHHSASAEGILGGGRNVRPGEITLAHFGALFLDEAPEFRAHVLQSLREPLEDRVITIVRAEGPQRLPADFQLIMAANSCPCGRLGGDSGGRPDPAGSGCFCSPDEIRRYWRKLGSALLDRIEIRVPVHSPGVLPPGLEGEGSAAAAGRAAAAVEIQRERFKGSPVRRNSRMSPGQIEKFCPLSDKAAGAFKAAAVKLGFSGRACHGILKTARTIADLDGKDSLDAVHILEAVEHRRYGDDPYDILSAGNQPP